MKGRTAGTLSCSVFHERAPEGGCAAFVPALLGRRTGDEVIELGDWKSAFRYDAQHEVIFSAAPPRREKSYALGW